MWDDLVDVPVAIPMRVPSAEMSRRKARVDHEEEEMDIGASYASAPIPRQMPQHDLLGSPTSELPNPNRFLTLTREDSMGDISHLHDEDPNQSNYHRWRWQFNLRCERCTKQFGEQRHPPISTISQERDALQL